MNNEKEDSLEELLVKANDYDVLSLYVFAHMNGLDMSIEAIKNEIRNRKLVREFKR
jgi:hypothetical protein